MRTLKQLLPLMALMLLLSACATPKGVIVETLEPPKIDITSEAALEGDAVMQNIIIDRIKTPNRTVISDPQVKFYVRQALEQALTDTQVFNFSGPGAQMNAPRITTVVEKFIVEPDKLESGYVTRRGVAAVSFALTSSSGHKVGSTLETAQIVNRVQAGGQLKSKEEIMRELAAKVCKNFVKKLVPTRKKQYREFASGNSEVKKGIDAAMNGDWDLAIEFWENALAKDPKNHAAVFNLGIAYEAKHKLRKAIKQYEKARRMDPGNPLYQKTYARVKSKKTTIRKIKKIKEEIREESVSASD
ncbi:tetratricopeptide repeat protein [Desulfovulcanus sp.]